MAEKPNLRKRAVQLLTLAILIGIGGCGIPTSPPDPTNTLVPTSYIFTPTVTLVPTQSPTPTATSTIPPKGSGSDYCIPNESEIKPPCKFQITQTLFTWRDIAREFYPDHNDLFNELRDYNRLSDTTYLQLSPPEVNHSDIPDPNDSTRITVILPPQKTLEDYANEMDSQSIFPTFRNDFLIGKGLPLCSALTTPPCYIYKTNMISTAQWNLLAEELYDEPNLGYVIICNNTIISYEIDDNTIIEHEQPRYIGQDGYLIIVPRLTDALKHHANCFK